ncbi:MAG: YqgE/AlgH family protein [Acidimicrobiales bacterium]|jgi:putative transcriptional regulator
MAHKTTAGKLLIATPAIGDGNFEQSIIYMLHHDMDGALGVVINRPSELLVEELLPRWSDLTTEPALVFSGGPVETNGFIGVARSVGPQPEGVIEIPGTNVITVDLEGDPALTAAHTDRLRLFRGYAGWGAHQLDTELSSGAWFTVFSDPGDLWSKAPDDLYEQVLRRQTGEMRWFANAPLDPKQN